MDGMDEIRRRLVDLERRVGNMVRFGTVAEVKYAPPRVRVKYDTDSAGRDVRTTWLPWMTRRAGVARDWWPPSVGEQVMIVSPSGVMESGSVWPAVYSDAAPPPSVSPSTHTMVYQDGATIEYDAASHHLKAVLPGGGTTELVSDGGVSIIGDVTVTGSIHASDDISTDANMQAAVNITAGADIGAGGDVAAAGEIQDSSGTMSTIRQIFNSHTQAVPQGGDTDPPHQQM
jgi:phage baseplate assembly protein V